MCHPIPTSEVIRPEKAGRMSRQEDVGSCPGFDWFLEISKRSLIHGVFLKYFWSMELLCFMHGGGLIGTIRNRKSSAKVLYNGLFLNLLDRSTIITYLQFVVYCWGIKMVLFPFKLTIHWPCVDWSAIFGLRVFSGPPNSSISGSWPLDTLGQGCLDRRRQVIPRQKTLQKVSSMCQVYPGSPSFPIWLIRIPYWINS